MVFELSTSRSCLSQARDLKLIKCCFIGFSIKRTPTMKKLIFVKITIDLFFQLIK